VARNPDADPGRPGGQQGCFAIQQSFRQMLVRWSSASLGPRREYYAR